MSLKAVELPTGYRVSWAFKVDQVTNFGQETFHTNRFGRLKTYSLSCFACLPCSEFQLQAGRTYEVRLRLQELVESNAASDGNEQDDRDDNEEDDRDSYDCEPWVVWHRIHGETYKKFETSWLKFWDSDVILVKEGRTSPNTDWAMQIEIWLEYRTAVEKSENVKTAGETNALRQFGELLTKQTLCDVQFQFQNGETIGGHRAVLAGRSAFFGKLFKLGETQSREIRVDDVESGIFRKLLHYIYCGKIPVRLSEDSAKQMHVAADKYGVDDLKEECTSYLLSCIRADNALRLIVWAKQHSVTLVQEAAVSYAIKHFKEISSTAEWGKLMRTCTELCLRITRGVADSIDSPAETDDDQDDD